MLGYPIDPTSFMNALSAGATGNIKPYLNTFFCSACGLCEMYSCFQNLNAQTLISVFKGGMRTGGVKMPEVQMAPVDPLRSQKLVSHARLTARLGLTQYNKNAPLNEEEPQVKQVKIMLSQHIGAPSEVVVKKGDKVTVGQIIGKASDDKLGVNIHSSVNGTVQEANDKYVKVTL
jgi:Na+-translocating ferredoxin:NAD+ oxidoreductase RnfC subunit